MSSLVFQAMSFATRAHADQKRKYTDQPYITHPAEVAGLVACVDPSSVALCAAWLHDVVEDCGVPLSHIEDVFGLRVAQVVGELTDVSKPSDGNRAARKAIDRAHIRVGSPIAHTIKYADLISNTRAIVQYDPAFAKVYLAEKRLLLDVLWGNHELQRLAEETWDAGMKALDARAG